MNFFPMRKPTQSEYAVLVVASSLLFVIVGIIELVFAFGAPESNHEATVDLAEHGFWSLGIGVAIGLAYSLYRRLKD
jgi:hypothetical protein